MERKFTTELTQPGWEAVCGRIDGLLDRQDRVLAAIDGSCGAGKTTLAGRLAAAYGCTVLHMDDFFLRPEQRTPERYAQPGGNVDYERFREEVLLPLTAGSPFTYRPFDCKTLTLAPGRQIVPGRLTVIEGSYCLHPYFGSPYDLRIFLTVEEDLQRQRILRRPKHLHSRFFETWIPMERRYAAEFSIPETCHLVL